MQSTFCVQDDAKASSKVKDWLEWIRQHVKATEQIHLAMVQHDMQELDEFAKMHNVSVAHDF